MVDAQPVETRLLVAAARLRVDGTSRPRLEQLLAQRVDWERVAAEAEGHRVAPLVYHTLSRPELAPLVPPATLAQLEGAYRVNGVFNLLWQHELRRVLAQLVGSGIPVVLLKGAALLHTVYPDAALRQLRDLDLLVAGRQLPAAELHLVALGYQPAEERWPVGQWPPEWYEKKYRRVTGGGRESLVEIHWGLARRGAPFRMGVTELMAASEPVVVDGVEARVLNPLHQILHLCTHLAYNDGFGVGLSRLSDLHQTVGAFRARIDWEELAEEARRFRASLCLRYSLAVASALLGTDLPPELLEGPRALPLRTTLAKAALERVLANDRDPSPLPSTMAKLVSTDGADFKTLLHLLLPHPQGLRHSYRLLQPGRLLRALQYARSVR